jgi:predicted nucleic acid-binding protein
MQENILLDLNVILDVLLARNGFESSRDILELSENGSHDLFISAHIVTTFAYLLENAKVAKPEILRQVEWLLATFQVVPVDGTLLNAALKSRVSDYEDAVIECAAVSCNAAVIITGNIKDFRTSVIRALTPRQYLAI